MRDYCPSRREQKKLKAKKVKARKVRRSKKKKASLINWQKLSLVFISLVLLVLLAGLLFYLLRSQLMKRHQLKRNQHLLIVEAARPFAWVVLAPAEQKIKVFNFNEFSLESWGGELDSLELNKDEEILFYSLIFNAFIDQVVDYPSQNLKQDQQKAFKDFLVTELQSRGVRNSAFYLERSQIVWEWFDESEAGDIEEKQLILNNFLNRNTSANYGKLFECPVAVINISGTVGLASAFAELLEKDGFSVVRRDSDRDIMLESSLLIDPKITACQPLLERFEQLVPGKTINANQELAQQYRAGAVIFLAEDLAQLRIRAFDLFHDGF